MQKVLLKIQGIKISRFRGNELGLNSKIVVGTYSEVPNRRADQNKRAGLEESDTLLAYLLSKLINEQGGIFHFTK